MGEKMTHTRVFVVFHHDSYEGCGEPAAAFAEEALADIFIAGTAAGCYGSWKIVELPIQSIADLAALARED